MRENPKDQLVIVNRSARSRHIIFSALFVAGVCLAGSSSYQANGQTPEDRPATHQTHQTQQAAKYTCPNHPEVVQDKPGNCPICGMKLVEKKDKPMLNQDSTKHKKMNHDTTGMKKSGMKHDSTYIKRESR